MITPQHMDERIVRYGDLIACKTDFIDAHMLGANEKENFIIIGSRVSGAPSQHVHIKDTPGFNIGARGQPPQCKNSLYMHTTAEAFFVLKGRWRFCWGNSGRAGEVTLEEGDIFNIPTGIFRNFENIGLDYGMIIVVRGGNDAGGSVIWAPQVIEDAKQHGLILGENGKLYDSQKDEQLPPDIKPMPVLSEKELKKLTAYSTSEIVPRFVARYGDLIALGDKKPVKVIAEDGLLKDKPGFEIDFIQRNSLDDAYYKTTQHEILMIVKGHWRITWQREGKTYFRTLAPGDTCCVLPKLEHKLSPAMAGEAAMYRIYSTDDPAGSTHWL